MAARHGRPREDADAATAGTALVFVSYGRLDADWVSRFATMLKPLVRERRMELWVDRDAIETGDRWREVLDGAIARSTVALLLVSPDFLASDFIMEEELPALRAAGVTLAPVLLRPCLHETAGLDDVQWARDLGAGPLSRADATSTRSCGCANRSTALSAVARSSSVRLAPAAAPGRPLLAPRRRR